MAKDIKFQIYKLFKYINYSNQLFNQLFDLRYQNIKDTKSQVSSKKPHP